jgi:hypothetical protein
MGIPGAVMLSVLDTLRFDRENDRYGSFTG